MPVNSFKIKEMKRITKLLLLFFTLFLLVLSTISCSRIKSTKYFEDGKRLLKQKKYEEAISSFENCLSLEPKTHQAAEAIGICYGEMKDYARAAEYFERALSIKPKDKLYLMNLAITYVKLKRYSEAKELYYRVLDIDDNNSSAKKAIDNIEKMGY